MVKGFGCRQAYESPSCRNPRATIDDYGDFGFRLMSSSVRRLPGSDRVDMDEPLRRFSARDCRHDERLTTTLSAS
jgi:hypothetical protein